MHVVVGTWLELLVPMADVLPTSTSWELELAASKNKMMANMVAIIHMMCVFPPPRGCCSSGSLCTCLVPSLLLGWLRWTITERLGSPCAAAYLK